MIAFRTLLLAWLAYSAAACGRAQTRVAARPACPSAWRAAWSSDSSIAVCLPPGFAAAAAASGALREGHERWERRPEAGQPVGDWLSVSLDTTAAPPPAGQWPRRLASGPGCLVDCATADSVATYREAVEGGATEAAVEVGLVSGGMPGFRRQPALVAGWATPEGTRVWVNGLAGRPGTLDTLRTMLRTVRIAAGRS